MAGRPEGVVSRKLPALSFFAQGAALMKGRANDEDPARSYPGDRPSTTMLLDDVDARSLGALIAFYEHRTFVNAAILGINAFDQFGVELGKEMARAADAGERPGRRGSTWKPARRWRRR